MPTNSLAAPGPMRHLARLTFVFFLLTFITSRTLVILIMTRHVPDLFLRLGGTHVHHLNYGIFLLSGVCGILLFAGINPKQRGWCAVIYEFGMWLHLGGSYWQRASFDAVVVVLTLLGLLAFLPRWQRVSRRHYFVGGILLIATTAFYVLLFKSLNHANDKLIPRLLKIERSGPT
jgi:hypothetical protein